MRIIVLGGAGDMARKAVRELASKADVPSVMVADYDASAANQLADKLGAKASALWLDANDHDALVAAMRAVTPPRAASVPSTAMRQGSRAQPSRPAYHTSVSVTTMTQPKLSWTWTVRPRRRVSRC
jgi:saccharopine dehydrogenase-like NADP-dependent oxidoreductase